MPKYEVTEIRCPDCGKLLAANISCTGLIDLYCKSCKETKTIELK